MATTYKTPGVYIEEIVKFPPSVAQVETAIPAFIGYTEKAAKKTENDLDRIPTRITSLLDYETYFGFAYPEDTISVDVTDVVTDNVVTERNIVVNQPSDPKPFLMYYALQMYFANGGGPCYIVSVKNYEDVNSKQNPVLFTDLTAGLDLLKAEDEPTLLLFPDAKALLEPDFYALYSNALIQCHDMQDRFAIIDTYNSTDIGEDSKALREQISLEKDYLKYGAAYYPYLDTILDYRYNEDDILINHVTNVPDAISTAFGEVEDALATVTLTTANLVVVTDDDADTVNDLISGSVASALTYIDSTAGYNNAAAGSETFTVAKTAAFVTILETLTADLNTLISEKDKIQNAAESAIASVEEVANAGDALQAALDVFVDLFEGNNKIEKVRDNLTDLTAKLKASNTNLKVAQNIKSNTVNVIDEIGKLLTFTVPTAPTNSIIELPNNNLVITVDVFNKATATEDMTTLVETIKDEINNVTTTDVNNGAMNGRFLGDIEGLDNKSYNAIKAEIAALPVTLPPSSAVAGIYARVDSNRGVWKAPANVGINYVIKPTLKITNGDQDNLNVDTVAGKSINAIRSFTGKGTLVWGSRTLAGNDNEWRYVPVRRFFNMAEESIKKATDQFVFEPNDANTWIRIRAMIENFLILQWRAGALAGAKPEQAFYVRVGLGQTMSALDILEGRMVIEVGMAVVRPAEFIILRFSHKMQES
ncbi:phage tail sheath C-terminal domain-containing protein [Flavobacterium sp. MC2016-06]|jgi:phage tail sheath protein FI|uniref:phage tail sheath C-terminal domain-containing protein n=1 Tax=Flavobacterium sp. MC2016-06 TaxID=2676308 RepID=UPI0012BA7CB0|nr:phage tail sheath C-terminal domain-containing protein [Flavobacterium sp. MC2016-06]MBU3857630.1 phage tail sheath subtilisin-like domain-containing protein [Flavobacterium sp. MC2016-06]